ncbi:MAG: lipopolysaccharide biosynthesis protein [Gordonia sp.]|uniref:lipopolysaccharide biosynthesis protein n=1 Tax=Gordonia sp. (in: high G+C Gram-positive bacteria) TaxID=84139 RepID=UPI001E132D3B|nr:lipopolysaccharide biosynthesis protein [Gordonia sp. (in: high G+C Gram-positive bacteria)]MCB1294347.1 lipopolysaccharide biosynthesis protein [Gordonia sp. (in: high G+C Gram-positive bacteria)]
MTHRAPEPEDKEPEDKEPEDKEPEDKEPGASGGLTGHLLKGAGAAAGGLVIVQGVGAVQTLVLGRLLGPAEVGLFIAGTVLLSFIAEITQGSMAQALIARRHDIERAANTALVVTFCTGVGFGLAVAAAAPLLAMIFHSDKVGWIAAASSGMVILHACTAVPDALMQREMKFYRRLVIDPIVTITYAVTAISLALAGFGAWSMVIGTYLSQIVWVIMSWWLARWRPSLRLASFRIWRELATFSAPLLVYALAEQSRDVLNQTIVGRVLGTPKLGQFRYGLRLGMMPSIAIIQVCSYVLLPAFAAIAGEAERFRHAYLRALGWIWCVAAPVGLVMIVAGEPVMVALLGEQWRPAGVLAEGLAGVGPGMALYAVAGEAVKGAGRTRVLMWLSIVDLGVGVPAVLVAAHHGLVYVGIVLSVMSLATGAACVMCARPIVGVSGRETLRCVVPAGAAAVISFAPLIAGRILLVDEQPGLPRVIVECLVYGVVYGLALAVVDRERVRVLLRLTGSLAGRLRARKPVEPE